MKAYRLNNIVHQLFSLVHLLFGIGHDQAVKIFLLIASVGSVRSALALFDGAFAANGYLGSGLRLHLLQGISTRSYK